MKWDFLVMTVTGIVYFFVATDFLVSQSLILRNIIALYV